MNIDRGYLFVLALWFFCGVNLAVADSKLPGSTFEDWSGVVNEVRLPDNSILFEYAARTFSGRTEGAMLALTFVPRFNCAPIITVRVPDNMASRSGTPTLLVEAGGVVSTHRAVIDSEAGYTTYAIAADIDELVGLREQFDVSPRVRFFMLDGAAQPQIQVGTSPASADSDIEGAESIVFSLIGSRLATLAVDNHCRSHQAVPYNPR